MIKSVIRVFGWSWRDIADLYTDAQDFQGLEFWYDDAAKTDNELKNEIANNNN